MSEMTATRVGEPVRRLRPLLPQQADRHRHQRDRLYRRRLRAARRQDLPLHRLCAPAARVHDCVKLTWRNVPRLTWLPPTCGYRLIAEGRDLPGGTRWSPATPTRCTRPASRCAGGWRRTRRTCRTSGWRITWWLAGEVAEGEQGEGAAEALNPTLPSFSRPGSVRIQGERRMADKDLFERYLLALRKTPIDEKTEHTDRGALQTLLQGLADESRRELWSNTSPSAWSTKVRPISKSQGRADPRLRREQGNRRKPR